MGVGIGGTVGSQFGGIAREINVKNMENTKKCPSCSSEMDATKRFCSDCGYDTLNSNEKEKDKILCNMCGAKLDSKANFCSSCGAQLITKCPKCGFETSDGAKFCIKCGEKLI
jgi:predicted amidophosphoribosyltransferase